MMKWMYLVCSCMMTWSCMPPVPASHSGTVEGWVRVVGPVRNATVSVRRVDERDGTCDAEPVGKADTDDDGYFFIEIGAAPGPLLIEVGGGDTSDCQSDEPIHWGPRNPDVPCGGRLTSIIVKRIPGQSHEVMVTPFTTLAETLGRRWFEDERVPGDSYLDAVIRAHERLGAHFSGRFTSGNTRGDLAGKGAAQRCLDREPSGDEQSHNDWRRLELVETKPGWGDGASLSEPHVRHELLLRALELLVEQVAGNAAVTSWNIRGLVDAMLEDARADGRLDGKVRHGSSVTSQDCQDCAIDGEVLRRRLVLAMDAVLREHAGGPGGLALADTGPFFFHVAANRDEELFGDGGAVGCDIAIEPLESWWINERDDVIGFDEAGMPAHVHGGERIDLAGAFNDGELVIHKHVNLLYPGSDNPLCWNFEVRDARFGVAGGGVQFRVGKQEEPGRAPVWIDGEWQPAEAVSSIPAGGHYQICLDRDNVPALATDEATFAIQIRARNPLGDEAILQGLWEHVPRAAPLRVLLPATSDCASALEDVGLEHDNLAPLIRGDTSASVLRLEVDNPNQDDVYLALSADVSGTYRRALSTSYVEVARETHQDRCLGEGTCRQDAPVPDDDVPDPAPLPSALVTAAWLLDQENNPVSCCPLGDGLPSSCAPRHDQALMGPVSCELRFEAESQYTLELRASGVGFLVPEDLRSSIEEISVGTGAERAHVTGRVTGDYIRCVDGEPDQGTCNARVIFDEFETLTWAAIDAQVSLQGAARPSLSVKTAVPPALPLNAHESTFSTNTELRLCWSTEEVLPEVP